jgi:hypothetical protein
MFRTSISYLHVQCLSFFVAQQTQSGLDRLNVEVPRSHAHTHTHTARTDPLNEWLARRSGRYSHNRKTQELNIFALSGIRNCDPAIELPQTCSYTIPNNEYLFLLLNRYTFWCERRDEQQRQAKADIFWTGIRDCVLVRVTGNWNRNGTDLQYLCTHKTRSGCARKWEKLSFLPRLTHKLNYELE